MKIRIHSAAHIPDLPSCLFHGQGSVEVSKALIPKEEQEFTQRKFRLQTAPAIAGRALSIDERVVGPSASLQGNTTTSMVAMPDPRDPAYRAQRRRQRRQQEEARRQRKCVLGMLPVVLFRSRARRPSLGNESLAPRVRP